MRLELPHIAKNESGGSISNHPGTFGWTLQYASSSISHHKARRSLLKIAASKGASPSGA
jgi:hypothetical protein